MNSQEITRPSAALAGLLFATWLPAQQELPVAVVPPSYAIQRPADLLPGAEQSWTCDIADTGVVAGSFRADGWKRTKAFAWRAGAIVDVVIPQPADSAAQPPVLPDTHRHVRATAINDSGVMVGDIYHRSLGVLYVGFYSPLPSTTLFPRLHVTTSGVSSSWMHDVSSTDPMFIVGAGLVPGAPSTMIRGVATQVDAQTGVLGPSEIIPSFGGPRARSHAYAVNRGGVVAGWAEYDDGFRRAFTWDRETGAMLDLGTLGGPSSTARDINDAGQVVGHADLSPGLHHACKWRGGSVLDLGTLGGATSEARGVNASGSVVGWSWTASGAVHAFLWSKGRMWDLNDLTASGSKDWVLQYAEAINASGAIAGWGRFDGETHGFVLTPH